MIQVFEHLKRTGRKGPSLVGQTQIDEWGSLMSHLQKVEHLTSHKALVCSSIAGKDKLPEMLGLPAKAPGLIEDKVASETSSGSGKVTFLSTSTPLPTKVGEF